VVNQRVFVSYARSDVDEDPVARRKKLTDIAEFVDHALGRAFVDEVHNAGGGHTEVKAALDAATTFCLVSGCSYHSRLWTNWEYARAKALGLQMYRLTYPELALTAGQVATAN
jgi:hypothetical protein